METLSPDQTRWQYNCFDIDYTLQIAEIFQQELANQPQSLQDFYHFQQNELSPALVNVMKRGVRVDLEKKTELREKLSHLMAEVEVKFNWLIGEEFNPKSSLQVKTLFKELLGVEPIQGKTGTDTFGSEAMVVYLENYPLLRPLITLLLEYRTLQVFVGTFLSAETDSDGRMRSSYNVAGTTTYRLASRKNAFGNGCMPVNETEAYTPTGWVNISEKPPIIAEYTKQGNIQFVPATWVSYAYKGFLHKYEGRCFRGSFTPDHRIIKIKRGKLHEKSALHTSNLQGSSSVVVSGVMQDSNNTVKFITDNWLQRLIMLSADGSKDSKYKWRIGVKKQRKKDRVCQILQVTESDSQKTTPGYIRFSVKHEGYTKILPSWLLQLPYRQRVLIIEELKHWDAHRRGKSYIYYTTLPSNADLVQTLAHLTGYSASINIDLTNSNEFGNTSTLPLYSVNVSPKRVNSIEGYRWQNRKFTGQVSCPTVPSSMWLVRHKGGVHITGNCNLQNIPSKGKLELNLSLAKVEVDEENDNPLLNVIYSDGIVELPNCKQLFIPDEGYTFFDVDFSGADAMVVAWDSQCEWLMNFFTTQTQKLYCYLGEQYLQEEVTTAHPMYGKLKRFCHLTNYGGKAEKAGRSCGMQKQDAKKLQNFYFKLCPEIPAWHKRLENEVKTKGYVENIFGARGWFLNRNDHTLMNKVYAWIPQSTIGILVNKGLVSIEKENKGLVYKQIGLEREYPIEVLMQVHDSLAGQFKTSDLTAPERILKHMTIELPYKRPLIIPSDIKTSLKSYGDCE